MLLNYLMLQIFQDKVISAYVIKRSSALLSAQSNDSNATSVADLLGKGVSVVFNISGHIQRDR